jgi:hypothetical protein
MVLPYCWHARVRTGASRHSVLETYDNDVREWHGGVTLQWCYSGVTVVLK